MLARLKRWLVPEKPKRDPEFAARMHTARAYGVTQKRESLKATRHLKREAASRLNPISNAAFPEHHDGGHR